MNEAERYKAATRIASKIYGSDPTNFDPQHYGRIRESLLGYSDEMLTKLHDSIGVEGGALDLIGYMIGDGDGENETGVKEALYFLDRTTETDTYPAVICNMVAGLHLTPGLPPSRDYSEADELTRKQCFALIHVLICIMQTGHRDGKRDVQKHRVVGNRMASFIDHEALIRVVMERPDEYPRIIQAITQRKTANPGVIIQVLDAPAPTLSDGLL